MPSFFSVIIATRNRPELFRAALQSVLAQSLSDVEIVVVNDGSSPEYQATYNAVLQAADGRRVVSIELAARVRGHGGSFALGSGASKATGLYLCFLDDDDTWTDPDHLRRAQEVIATASTEVDVYLSNQAAFLHDEQRLGPIWIEDLPPILAKRGHVPDRHGSYNVTIDDLLLSHGFAHLNTIIVRRDLYERVGGLDEKNGWEYDRDLYLRLIDQAISIKYLPVAIGRHSIPDPAKRANVTTAQSEIDRHLSQIRLLDRAILSAQHAAIRMYGCRHKAYTLKRIAETLAAAGRHHEAAFYAREALGAGPTAKWAAYTAWRILRALMKPNPADI